MDGIIIEELMQLPEATIVDIRKRSEYCKGHIKDAINIPYYTLLSDYSSYLEKDKVYYLCCSSGAKSADVVIQLNKLGYNTVNIIGGYDCYENKVR